MDIFNDIHTKARITSHYLKLLFNIEINLKARPNINKRVYSGESMRLIKYPTNAHLHQRYIIEFTEMTLNFLLNDFEVLLSIMLNHKNEINNKVFFDNININLSLKTLSLLDFVYIICNMNSDTNILGRVCEILLYSKPKNFANCSKNDKEIFLDNFIDIATSIYLLYKYQSQLEESKIFKSHIQKVFKTIYTLFFYMPQKFLHFASLHCSNLIKPIMSGNINPLPSGESSINDFKEKLKINWIMLKMTFGTTYSEKLKDQLSNLRKSTSENQGISGTTTASDGTNVASSSNYDQIPSLNSDLIESVSFGGQMMPSNLQLEVQDTRSFFSSISNMPPNNHPNRNFILNNQHQVSSNSTLVENADSNLPNSETNGQSSEESTSSLNGTSGLSDEDSESSNIPNVVRFQNAPRTFDNHPNAGPNTKNSHDSETMCRLKLAKAFINTVQELCDLAAVGLVLSSNLKSDEMTKNELNFANQIKNSVSKIKVSFEGVFKWLIDKLNDMNEKVKMKIKNNAQSKHYKTNEETQPPDIYLYQNTQTNQEVAFMNFMMSTMANSDKIMQTNDHISSKDIEITLIILNTLLYFLKTSSFADQYKSGRSPIAKMFDFKGTKTPGYEFNFTMDCEPNKILPMAFKPFMPDEKTSKHELYNLKVKTIDGSLFELFKNNCFDNVADKIFLKFRSIIHYACNSSNPEHKTFCINPAISYYFKKFSIKQRSLHDQLHYNFLAAKNERIKLDISRDPAQSIPALFNILEYAYSLAVQNFEGSAEFRNNKLKGKKVVFFPPSLIVSYADEMAEGIGVLRAFIAETTKTLVDMEDLLETNVCVDIQFAPAHFSSNQDQFSDSESGLKVERNINVQNILNVKPENYKNVYKDLSEYFCATDPQRYRTLKSLLKNKNINYDLHDICQSLSEREKLIAKIDYSDFNDGYDQLYSIEDFKISKIINEGSILLKNSKGRLFSSQKNKSSFLSPKISEFSNLRLQYFLMVGRILAMALYRKIKTNFNFARHIFKYILNQKIEWVDLAFVDLELFKNFSRMLKISADPEQCDTIKDYEIYFEYQLPQSDGEGIIELIPNGSNILVTHKNVTQYIKKYTKMVLVTLVEPYLYQIRKGFLQCVPQSDITHISPEDMRWMLVFSQSVDVEKMIEIISFDRKDSVTCPKEFASFTKSFSKLLREFDQEQLKNLLFFWTSVPSLEPDLKLSCCLGSLSDTRLPSSNTCINKLTVPHYSTFEIMKSKMLQAMMVDYFGFI